MWDGDEKPRSRRSVGTRGLSVPSPAPRCSRRRPIRPAEDSRKILSGPTPFAPIPNIETETDGPPRPSGPPPGPAGTVMPGRSGPPSIPPLWGAGRIDRPRSRAPTLSSTTATSAIAARPRREGRAARRGRAMARRRHPPTPPPPLLAGSPGSGKPGSQQIPPGDGDDRGGSGTTGPAVRLIPNAIKKSRPLVTPRPLAAFLRPVLPDGSVGRVRGRVEENREEQRTENRSRRREIEALRRPRSASFVPPSVLCLLFSVFCLCDSSRPLATFPVHPLTASPSRPSGGPGSRGGSRGRRPRIRGRRRGRRCPIRAA